MARNLDEYFGVMPAEEHAVNDFGLIDFTDDAVFCQFVDFIRGNEPPANFDVHGYCGGDDGLAGDYHRLLSPPVGLMFDFDVAANLEDNSDAALDALLEAEGIEEEVMDVEDSSGTASTTAARTGKKKIGGKVDRARTLVSERKRRGRMKERLYELRSLVPNITKMDKASIVGDAVLYLQDLQTKVKTLKSEISTLESSLKGGDDKHQVVMRSDKLTMNSRSLYPMFKKIHKMDVFQVEEKGFYVRVLANKESGVAMLLYKALESLTSFSVHSSNLTASSTNYVFTFNFQVAMHGLDVDLTDLKLWIAGVFLDQGFDFDPSAFHSPCF